MIYLAQYEKEGSGHEKYPSYIRIPRLYDRGELIRVIGAGWGVCRVGTWMWCCDKHKSDFPMKGLIFLIETENNPENHDFSIHFVIDIELLN